MSRPLWICAMYINVIMRVCVGALSDYVHTHTDNMPSQKKKCASVVIVVVAVVACVQAAPNYIRSFNEWGRKFQFNQLGQWNVNLVFRRHLRCEDSQKKNHQIKWKNVFWSQCDIRCVDFLWKIVEKKYVFLEIAAGYADCDENYFNQPQPEPEFTYVIYDEPQALAFPLESPDEALALLESPNIDDLLPDGCPGLRGDSDDGPRQLIRPIKRGRAKKKPVVQKMREGCALGCRFKCQEKITHAERLAIFNEFCKLTGRPKQWEFVNRYFSTTEPKERRSKQESSTEPRKKHSHVFTLPAGSKNVKVCATMFLDTFGKASGQNFTGELEEDFQLILFQEYRPSGCKPLTKKRARRRIRLLTLRTNEENMPRESREFHMIPWYITFFIEWKFDLGLK